MLKREICNLRKSLALLVLAVATTPLAAQNPADAFNASFAAACAGAAAASDLGRRCAEVFAMSPGSGARTSSAGGGNRFNTVPVQGRIAALSDNTESGSLRAETDPNGGRVEASKDFAFWSLNASAGFARVSRDDGPAETGFDNDRSFARFGVDRRISERGVLGVALNWLRDDTSLDTGAGDQQQQSVSLSAHGLWWPAPRWTLYGQLEFGQVDLDTRREIDYVLSYPGSGASDVRFRSTALGRTDGDRSAAAFGVERSLVEGDFNLRLDLGLDHERTDFDALSETGGAGFAVSLPDRSIRSTQSRLGLSGDLVRSTASGVVSFHGRAWWRHEFDNDGRAVAVRLIGDTAGTPIVFRTPDPDRDFLEAGLGVAWLFSGGRSLYFDVDSRLGDSILSGYGVSIGGAIEF